MFLREKVFYDILGNRGPKLFGILDLFFGNERVRYAVPIDSYDRRRIQRDVYLGENRITFRSMQSVRIFIKKIDSTYVLYLLSYFIN